MYISPTKGDTPVEPISTNFHNSLHLTDIINSSKFGGYCYRSFCSGELQKLLFPIGTITGPCHCSATGLARDLYYSIELISQFSWSEVYSSYYSSNYCMHYCYLSHWLLWLCFTQSNFLNLSSTLLLLVLNKPPKFHLNSYYKISTYVVNECVLLYVITKCSNEFVCQASVIVGI